MDTFSHGAWGFMLLHRLPRRIAIAGAIGGMLPDLLFFIPSRLEQLVEHGWQGLMTGSDPNIWRGDGPPLPPDLVRAYWRYYVYSHSLVILAAVLALAWLALRRSPHRVWLWLAAPYALHIVMDMPTHERYRTQPFYPLSDWQITGLTWTDPRIFWPHAVILIATATWLWLAARARRA